MMHAKTLTEGFRYAVEDYLLLVERRYAQAAALKLVGDRYQLTSVQRSMLYRGVVSSRKALQRLEKKTSSVLAATTCIDALNVLYTIANYLYGRVLFISTDSWLRDAGEVHGSGIVSGGRGSTLDSAVRLLIEWLTAQQPRAATFYVDQPVSMSGRLASTLRRELCEAGIPGDAVTVPSADYALKRVSDSVVATSDSTIIDASSTAVCDMAHEVIQERFAPELIDLRALVAGGCT